MMAREKKCGDKVSEEDVIQAFRMFDSDGNGFIGEQRSYKNGSEVFFKYFFIF